MHRYKVGLLKQFVQFHPLNAQLRCQFNVGHRGKDKHLHAKGLCQARNLCCNVTQPNQSKSTAAQFKSTQLLIWTIAIQVPGYITRRIRPGKAAASIPQIASGSQSLVTAGNVTSLSQHQADGKFCGCVGISSRGMNDGDPT